MESLKLTFPRSFSKERVYESDQVAPSSPLRSPNEPAYFSVLGICARCSLCLKHVLLYCIVLYCVFFLLSASHTSFPWHLIFQASALLRSLEWVKVSAIIPPSQLWSHCILILVVFSTRCKLCEGRGDLSRLLLFLWHPQNAWLLVGTQPNISLKKKQWQNIPWLVNYSVRNTMDHCLPLCCPVQYRPTELVAMMEMLHSLHRSVQ